MIGALVQNETLKILRRRRFMVYLKNRCHALLQPKRFVTARSVSLTRS